MERFRLLMIVLCTALLLYWGITLTKAVGNLYEVVKALDHQIAVLKKEDHHVGNPGQGEIQP